MIRDLNDKSNFNNVDVEFERKIRPSHFNDFMGQTEVIDNLKVFVQAALSRKEPLDHIIFNGPPGLGKTTLANIISNELSVNIKVTSGPSLDKPANLAGILTSLEPNDVLFIDEIHRINSYIEEYLYSAMEDYKIDIIIDSGPNARTIELNLNPFTLIGATTRLGLLTKPLRTRFGINCRLEYYDKDILSDVVSRNSKILKIDIVPEAANEIAKRSRGTPRVSNSLLRRVRDFAQVKGSGKIDLEITNHALKSLKVDQYGLDDMDNKIISVLINIFKGGPVGINTLATSINEDPGTIEEVYEPYLIMKGFIQRTPRGREATKMAYEHIGLVKPNDNTLF